MTIDLLFDGSTECRGRNRWFQLREAHISCYHDLRGEEGYGVSVGLFSKTRGDMPPIMLRITNPEELRTLICGLAKALAQMTAITEED